MPRGDGTGPDGNGPRTGRGNGPCKPNDSNRDSNREGNGSRGSNNSNRGRRGH